MTTIIKQAKLLYNLPRIVHLLAQEKWTWAKTMPGIPHEYIVRGKCRMGEEDFLMIVHAQRDLGKYEVWGKYNFPYLYLDGYKYWTMGDSYENTIILNRQKVFAEFDELENPAQLYYTEEMFQKVACNINKLFPNLPFFEVIGGDCSLASLLNVSPAMYRGCHASKKMNEAFKAKDPHLANRIINCSFEECYHQWRASAEVIVATFGTPNYIMKTYLEMLANHCRKVFLMFYKEGYCPLLYRSMNHYEYSLKDIKELFNGYHCVEYEDYIVVYG